jgi:hypothetical protein
MPPTLRRPAYPVKSNGMDLPITKEGKRSGGRALNRADHRHSYPARPQKKQRRPPLFLRQSQAHGDRCNGKPQLRGGDWRRRGDFVEGQFLGEAFAAQAAFGLIFGKRQDVGEFRAPATVVSITGHRRVALSAEGLHMQIMRICRRLWQVE